MAQAVSNATNAPMKNTILIGEAEVPIRAEEFQKIVAGAIESETESHAFYTSAAGKVRSDALRTLFRDLAGEELGDREFLENYRDNDPKVMNFEVRDYKVTDALRTPELSADMKPLEGMVLAIKRELESMTKNRQLAEAATDAGQKKLYMDLATMAQANKGRLEDIYTNMAFPEAW